MTLWLLHGRVDLLVRRQLRVGETTEALATRRFDKDKIRHDVQDFRACLGVNFYTLQAVKL